VVHFGRKAHSPPAGIVVIAELAAGHLHRHMAQARAVEEFARQLSARRRVTRRDPKVLVESGPHLPLGVQGQGRRGQQQRQIERCEPDGVKGVWHCSTTSESQPVALLLYMMHACAWKRRVPHAESFGFPPHPNCVPGATRKPLAKSRPDMRRPPAGCTVRRPNRPSPVCTIKDSSSTPATTPGAPAFPGSAALFHTLKGAPARRLSAPG